jgi:hypothetical protein
MIIPVSFKIPDNVPMELINDWLRNNSLYNEFSWDWHRHIITFENEDAAMLFSLTFGIPRYKTLVEQKIQKEENDV